MVEKKRGKDGVRGELEREDRVIEEGRKEEKEGRERRGKREEGENMKMCVVVGTSFHHSFLGFSLRARLLRGDVISYTGEGSHLLSCKVRAEASLCSCSYLSGVQCWDMGSPTLSGIL